MLGDFPRHDAAVQDELRRPFARRHRPAGLRLSGLIGLL
jgi:hypothetical protein